MNILKGLNPEKVFYYFEEISSIPRGSGHTDKIREYCEKFASDRNLRYISDDSDNIIIFKNGSAGRENEEPVIIQGHTDIVWEKDETCTINFETDGLELFVDGDYIGAKGTTLGGDDGIAVAMCLALLDSDEYSHPPLEILFTSDEEVGMLGADALDVSPLKGKRMINADSEAEGTLWVSCAGGARTDINFEPVYIDEKNNVFCISVSGLLGGHSVAEIHNGYLNANQVMGKVLKELSKKISFNIIDINGGKMDNAITRESVCVISTSKEDISAYINEIYTVISSECKNTDPDIIISASVTKSEMKAMDSASTAKIKDLLNTLPGGVIAWSKEIDGLVQTSLNLGILSHSDNKVSFSFSVRSSKDNEKNELLARLKNIAKDFECNITVYGEYPAWEYKEESQLRDTMAEVYKDMFGKEMTVTAIHAGLECGLFCGKIKGLDCVSFGPDMHDIHTPSERLSISSTERMWNYLLRVLEKI